MQNETEKRPLLFCFETFSPKTIILFDSDHKNPFAHLLLILAHESTWLTSSFLLGGNVFRKTMLLERTWKRTEKAANMVQTRNNIKDENGLLNDQTGSSWWSMLYYNNMLIFWNCSSQSSVNDRDLHVLVKTTSSECILKHLQYTSCSEKPWSNSKYEEERKEYGSLVCDKS